MILAMMLVTYLPRVLPLILLSKIKIPDYVIRVLKYVGPAILASLLAPAIFITEGRIDLSFNNTFLLAAIPTFITAFLSRSIFITVFSGLAFLYIITIIL